MRAYVPNTNNYYLHLAISSQVNQCSTVWVGRDLTDPMDYTVYGILRARMLEWVPFPSPGHLPNPEIESRSPALQADSLPAEPQGKPKNTEVGSLFLLQHIFPT